MGGKNTTGALLLGRCGIKLKGFTFFRESLKLSEDRSEDTKQACVLSVPNLGVRKCAIFL